MAMRRELRWLYRLLLKSNGRVVSIRRVLGSYEEYEALRKRLGEDEDTPGSLKSSLRPVNKPGYLEWVSQYVIYGDQDEFKPN